MEVRGTTGMIGVVDELGVEDAEERVGDSVTVGSTVVVNVLPTTPFRGEVSMMQDRGGGPKR